MKTFDLICLLLRRRWPLLLTLVWLLGCRQEIEQPPQGLISEDKMAQILSEIHLAEAKAGKLGVTAADSTSLLYKAIEKQIYARYKVDTAAYTRSYIYYSTDPDRMTELYKKVVEKLSKKTDSTRSPNRDSLRSLTGRIGEAMGK